MFKCKNMQNSRSKCYQMQIQGKVCLWLENFAEMPSPEDMKGVKDMYMSQCKLKSS